APARSSEKPPLFDQGHIHGRKSGDDRLHGKGQTINRRPDDESGKSKGQRMTEKMNPEAPDSRVLAQQNQQIKTEHRGRKQNWESGYGFNQSAKSRARGHNPEGKRNGDDQQNRSRDGSEPQADGKGLQVHAAIPQCAAARPPASSWRAMAPEAR